MTKDEIVENYMTYKEFLLKEDGTVNEAVLKTLIEGVERDARGAAVKSIFACANAVNNNIDVDRELTKARFNEGK